MPIRGSQQVAEALKMLGINLPAPAPMPDMQPGTPGYDPTTLANKIDNPSVMDPTWLNLLRTGQNTLERVGQMGKGLITGGSETPGPSAENLGAILGAIGPLLSKIVYHGSPHVFDKFDMGKIGTGEGAQAYGHGLYFADAKDIASGYRARLTADEVVKQRNAAAAYAASKWSESGLPSGTSRMALQGDIAAGHVGPSKMPKPVRDVYLDALERQPGATYDVDLPDDAIAKMLDWDAPLSQQREISLAVRKALQGHKGFKGLSPDASGRELYEELQNYALRYDGNVLNEAFKAGGGGDQKIVASKFLRDLGVPGIRYYDGASRGAGQGTRNYVVFDDQLPKIVKVTR